MVPSKSLKTVLITGAGSGIGLETARQLLETRQYHLVLLGKDEDKLEDAQKKLQAGSEFASFHTCDLRDSAQIVRTLQKVMSVHRSIYGLVNNAGIYPFGGVGSTTETQWDETFAVNLKAPFFLIQALVPLMSKSGIGGRVVNVSSTAGLLPNHFALAYSVSKGALIHLTKTLAKELGKNGITVNCVCPGIVRSPMHEAYHRSEAEAEEFYAKRGASFPLGRVGEPKDIAAAIKYFLSEEASWVTGDVLVADGGRLLQ